MCPAIRSSPVLLALAFLALVACQWATAAQWCGTASERPVADTPRVLADEVHGCHGLGSGEDSSESSACPDIDKAPDWGKQPAFQPLAIGHEWPSIVLRIDASWSASGCVSPPGQAPPLAELCRLLI
jgi:hypothetical protein